MSYLHVYNENFSNVTNKLNNITLKIYVYSVSDNKVNQERIELVKKICDEQNLDCEIDLEPKVSPFHSRVIHNRYKKILEEIIKNYAPTLRNKDENLVVITQDDTFFIDNFREELLKTIKSLPEDWRILHLCPGCLWMRNKEFIHALYSDAIPNYRAIRIVDLIKKHKKCWMGNPVAFCIRVRDAEKILKWYETVSDDFDSARADDTLFNFYHVKDEKYHNKEDYVTLDPVLCKSEDNYRTTRG